MTRPAATVTSTHSTFRRALPRAAVVVLAALLATAAWAGGKLAVSPASASTTPGGSVAFGASGGAGGYAWALSANGSGGSIDPASGAYTAGAQGGTTDTVTVTDSAGKTASATVTVAASAQGAPTQDLGGHR